MDSDATQTRNLKLREYRTERVARWLYNRFGDSWGEREPMWEELHPAVRTTYRTAARNVIRMVLHRGKSASSESTGQA
jgi:hypothetical protein